MSFIIETLYCMYISELVLHIFLNGSYIVSIINLCLLSPLSSSLIVFSCHFTTLFYIILWNESIHGTQKLILANSLYSLGKSVPPIFFLCPNRSIHPNPNFPFSPSFPPSSPLTIYHTSSFPTFSYSIDHGLLRHPPFPLSIHTQIYICTYN